MKMDIASIRWKPSAQFWTPSPAGMLKWVGRVCTKFGTVILSTYKADDGTFEHHLELYRHPFMHRTYFYDERTERGLVLMANKFARQCANSTPGGRP